MTGEMALSSVDAGPSSVVATIERLRESFWQKQAYTPKDALIFRTETGIFIAPYSGQAYDPNAAELKEGYWDHDNCEACGRLLCQSDDPAQGTGYTDGDVWVCAECHDKLLSLE